MNVIKNILIFAILCLSVTLWFILPPVFSNRQIEIITNHQNLLIERYLLESSNSNLQKELEDQIGLEQIYSDDHRGRYFDKLWDNYQKNPTLYSSMPKEIFSDKFVEMTRILDGRESYTLSGKNDSLLLYHLRLASGNLERIRDIITEYGLRGEVINVEYDDEKRLILEDAINSIELILYHTNSSYSQKSYTLSREYGELRHNYYLHSKYKPIVYHILQLTIDHLRNLENKENSSSPFRRYLSEFCSTVFQNRAEDITLRMICGEYLLIELEDEEIYHLFSEELMIESSMYNSSYEYEVFTNYLIHHLRSAKDGMLQLY